MDNGTSLNTSTSITPNESLDAQTQFSNCFPLHSNSSFNLQQQYYHAQNNLPLSFNNKILPTNITTEVYYLFFKFTKYFLIIDSSCTPSTNSKRKPWFN